MARLKDTGDLNDADDKMLAGIVESFVAEGGFAKKWSCFIILYSY